MRVRFLISVSALTVLLAPSAHSETHFERDPVLLYQPDAPLQARLSSAGELADYILRLQKVGTAFFASEQTPETLDVVVGLKPGKKVRIWFVSSRRNSNDKALLALRRKLEAVAPCNVQAGPVAFALRWNIAGIKAQAFNGHPPMPKEWRDAAGNDKTLIVPDGVFERIWRD
jgi:hypothetical protein